MMQHSRLSKFEIALNEVIAEDESGQSEAELKHEFDTKQTQLVEANLARDYKKAQKLHEELQVLAELRKEKKAEAVERLHAQERRAIELYFDKQCKELVGKYSKKIENFALKMDELIKSTKDKHESEINQLSDALKKSYPKIGVNKTLLGMRQLEFNLAQERRFAEAEEMKNKISEMEKQLITEKNKEKHEHDMESMNELKKTQKKEVDRLINRMVLEKERLYTKLKQELKSLENWKIQQQKKIENTHKKDLEQTKTLVNRQIRKSLFNRVSVHLVNGVDGKKPGDTGFAAGSYRSSIMVPWVQDTVKEMAERLKSVSELNDNTGDNKICNIFIQHDIEGKLEARKVNLKYDESKKSIVYKSLKNNIKFEYDVKDVVDVEYPFKVADKNPNCGFKIIGRQHDLVFVGKDKQSVLSIIMDITGNASGEKVTKQFFNINKQ